MASFKKDFILSTDAYGMTQYFRDESGAMYVFGRDSSSAVFWVPIRTTIFEGTTYFALDVECRQIQASTVSDLTFAEVCRTRT